jgi:hypothetical protein
VGDDDVRLTDGERAAFAELARQLTDDRTARRSRLTTWHTLPQPIRRAALAWLLVVGGIAGLVAALVTAPVWIGGVAFVVLVVGLHLLTRRWNWLRLLRWWSRRPPEPPSAM